MKHGDVRETMPEEVPGSSLPPKGKGRRLRTSRRADRQLRLLICTKSTFALRRFSGAYRLTG